MTSNNHPPSIVELFSNNKNYQEHREFFRNKIRSNNQQLTSLSRQYIVNIIIAIMQTLKSPTQNPINKLLALRLFRQCINCISYGFLSLANVFLCPILIEIALYKKQSQQQKRGRTLFTTKQFRNIDKNQLEIIGYSFHKLVLQIYKTMYQWLPFLPYHQQNLISNFTKGYQILRKQNVKFPEQMTYFKSKDSQKFFQQYNARKIQSQDIKQFYQYIFSPKYMNQELPRQKIIISILRTGDIFLCNQFLKYVQSRSSQLLRGIEKQYFEKDLFELMDFIYSGLKSGQYEFLIAIQPQILPFFLKLILKDSPIKNQRTRRRIQTIIWQWSQILKQIPEIDTNKTFKTLNKLIDNGPKPIIEQKMFKKNWQELKQTNKIKTKICSEKYKKTNLETIQFYLSQLSEQQSTSKMFDKIVINNINGDGSNSKISNQFKTPKNSVNIQHLSFKEQIKSGMDTTDRKKLKQQIQLLRSLNKKNTPRSKVMLNAYQAESYKIIPNSNNRYSQSSDKFQSQHSIKSENYDKKIEQLEKIIQISKKKQKKYQLIIEQQNYQIASLSAQVTPLKSKVFDQQLLSHSNISKSRDIIGPGKQNPLSHLQTRSNKPQKKLFMFPPKTKRQLLKNKLLLTKSVQIELGMINLGFEKNSSNTINVNIYVTPMINFESISSSIRCPQWISAEICQNQIKHNIKASSQYILSLKFKLKQKENRKHYNSLPEFTLKGVKQDKNIEIKLYLPIFLNRFIQLTNFKAEQCDKFLTKQIEGELFRKQEKLLKNFQVLLHYFPTAIMLGDKNLYVLKIMFQTNQAYLFIKIINKQYAVIQLIQQGKWDLDQLQLIGNVYRSLLTIVN